MLVNDVTTKYQRFIIVHISKSVPIDKTSHKKPKRSCNISDLENVKKEDVTFSLLRSMAEFQGQMLHAHALAHEVRKIYLVGSFIDIPLVRRFVTEEIQGRNLLRPKVFQTLLL